VFTGSSEPLELREFPLPRLGDREMLVRVECCTLCGSDLHTFQGRRHGPCPTVLGHEILGRVAEAPKGGELRDFNGRPLAVGDRVTWSLVASCGGCFYCSHDLPQKCTQQFKYGHELLTDEHPLSGGLAEHCHLAPGTAVFRIPDDLPDELLCPVNCATATVAAALRAVGDCRERVLLVQGAGMLGLTACAMARTRGAREVIVCDVRPERLSMALQFGATKAVDVSSDVEQLRYAVEQITDGRGVDLAAELSGAPDAVEAGLDLLRIGGTYVLVGSVFPAPPVPLSAESVVRRLLSIHGVHNYTPQDLAAALEFLAGSHGDFPFADLVGAQFPLSEAAAAFRHAIEAKPFRVAVKPECGNS